MSLSAETSTDCCGHRPQKSMSHGGLIFMARGLNTVLAIIIGAGPTVEGLNQGCLCPPIVLQLSSQNKIGGQMEDITGGHGGHTGGH